MIPKSLRHSALLGSNIKLKNSKSKICCCIVLLLILGLGGCGSSFVTKGGLSVLAEIQNTQGQQLNICEIELQNQQGKTLQGPDSIPGKFHKVFIVAPYQADYLIVISCPGFKVYQTSATYGENITPIKPMKLGVITMELVQN